MYFNVNCFPFLQKNIIYMRLKQFLIDILSGSLHALFTWFNTIFRFEMSEMLNVHFTRTGNRKRKNDRFDVDKSEEKMGILIFLLILIILFICRHFLLKYLSRKMPVLFEKSPPDAEPLFPAVFKYGISTSAYQIEADIPPSNWSLWSQKTDARGIPLCPEERIKCDGFNKYQLDADNAINLGCQEFRFSVSWSRVNPSDGQFNRNALLVYRNLCIYLKQNGVEPIVTLWHYEHPAWIENNGSICNPNFVQKYGEFVEFVVSGLADVCEKYITINEPVRYVVYSYIKGKYPPGKGSFSDAWKALINLYKCHAIGYQIIHRLCQSAKVSYVKNIIPFVPRHKFSLLETSIAHLLNHYNRIGFDAIETGVLSCYLKKEELNGLKDSIDFICISHNYPMFVTLNWNEFSNGMKFLTYGEKFLSISDAGYGIMPGSLAGSVKWINKEMNPKKRNILIAEHGIADRDDFRRQWFLKESLQHLSQLVSERVPMIGYLHWTLTDNYSWTNGNNHRYGLFEIDYRTQERRKRKSGEIYEEFVKSQRTRTSFC